MNYDLAELMKNALEKNMEITNSASDQNVFSSENFEKTFGVSLFNYANSILDGDSSGLDPRIAYILKIITQNTQTLNTGLDKTESSESLSKETIKKRFE